MARKVSIATADDERWKTFFAEVEDYLPQEDKLPKKVWYGPSHDGIAELYAPKLPEAQRLKKLHEILIVGERGTGKEFIAQRLAQCWGNAIGKKSQKLYQDTIINCAGLVPQLALAELFGYVKGAFTGANRSAPGVFTHFLDDVDQKKFGITDSFELNFCVFLDELHHLPLDIQAALLRAVEYGVIQPLGAAPCKFDKKRRPRIVAAIQPKYVNDDTRILPDLRERFMYTVNVEPLSACPFMIPRLVSMYLYDISRQNPLDDTQKEYLKGIQVKELDVWHLMVHRWPGNIRELKRMMIQTEIPQDTSKPICFEFPWSSYPDDLIHDAVFKEAFSRDDQGHQQKKPYSSERLLSLADLWDYGTFAQRRAKGYTDACIATELGYLYHQQERIREERHAEYNLRERAKEMAKLDKYREEAELELSGAARSKPKSLDELNKLHKKLGTWEKVAMHCRCNRVTISRWRRQLPS